MLHGGEGGPVRASKAQRNFGVRAYSVRLGSLKGSSARAPAETGPRSVGKGQGPLRQDLSPFWRRLRKKDWPS
jgi:hypothetical protein